MIQLQDVIQFYIGCNCLRPDNKTTLPIYGVQGNLIVHCEGNRLTYSGIAGSKPILRKLSDMTVDELHEIVKIQPDVDHINIGAARSRFNAWCRGEITIGGSLLNHAEIFTYLIKQGFDLFGLIDSNQAIDTSTIEKQR